MVFYMLEKWDHHGIIVEKNHPISSAPWLGNPSKIVGFFEWDTHRATLWLCQT